MLCPVSRASTNPRTGVYSVKGTLSSNGTQYARKSSESLTAGTTYTFSAFVNTNGVTRFNGTGIYLKVTDSSNNSWTSHPVNYATAAAVDDGWVRVSVTFTAKTTGAHTVAVYNSGAIGTFYADDFQLEKGEAPSSYNLAENGSMEMSTYAWTMMDGASISTDRGAAASASSLKIVGDPENSSTKAYQDIPLNLPGTQTYVVSAWAYANAVPDDADHLTDPADDTKKCGLRITVTYSDETYDQYFVPFNSDLSNTWQFLSTTIVPKSPTKTVSTIRVTCAYDANANVAYFDNVSVLREAAQTMRYDEDGNLISVESPGLEEDVNTYSGGNLIKTVTGGNGTYNYTYDTTYTHRLKSVTNGQITQSMGYDGTGNVTTTTLSGTGGKTIGTSAEYGGGKNRLVSITDATGATVSYGYGNANAQMMALPTSITDPNGTVTYTDYDSNYRVSRTGIASVASLVYNYSSSNLSSVKRTNDASSSQTYSFTYDAFGNMTALKVGSQTLATYTYGTGNGLLKSQTYANGDSVSFTYDNLGRTKTATYSDGRVLTYTYNGEGRLHSIKETGNGANTTYLYTYDSLGRLISSEQKEGTTTTLRTNQNFNEYNQMTKQGWQMGSTAYSETYTYNSADGSLNTMTTGVGNTLTMGYDGLRRLSTITGGPFNRSYTYRDISSTATTMQVSQLSYPNLGNGLSFGYTYDNLGNIATYTAPDGEVITYTYDNQGQLLSAAGDTTYTYTYDTVGNILTANGHTYTYGNANWKDLLTAFDGETITYDSSGNPTSYYNGTRWTLEWNNGRQLVSASDGTTTITYTYDTNGLRTGKTVTTNITAASQHTVTFVADGVTICTLTVDDGYTLTAADYPQVPAKSGYTGSWQQHNAPITSDVTIQAVYTAIPTHTVTFKADGVTVDTLTVEDGYVLTSADYPQVPAKSGYTGSWPQRTAPVTSDITITAVYTPVETEPTEPEPTEPETTTHTVTFRVTYSGSSYGYTVKTMTVNDGYVLTDDDYPSVGMGNYGITWQRYTNPITSDVTINGSYSWGGMSGYSLNRSAAEVDTITEEYDYIYAGGKLMREVVTTTEGGTTTTRTLDFFYDANGTPYALKYNGTVYYYVTNLQGDVTKLVTSNGATAASYEYDPYGNNISAAGDLAEINPIRYRGYYYDTETGLYYLQSRYYDPSIGRFVNADSYASTGQSVIGHNMYAYCNNNPLCNIDASGTIFFTALGAVTGFISGAISAMATEEDSSKWFDIATQGAIGGAIAGAGVDAALLMMGTLGVGAPVVVGAFAIAYATGGAANVYTSYSTAKICGTEYSSDQAVGMFIIGGTFNCLSLATGLTTTAKSVEQLVFLGTQDIVENTSVGTVIGVSTSVATTVGTTSKPKASTINRSSSSASLKKRNEYYDKKLYNILTFKERMYL